MAVSPPKTHCHTDKRQMYSSQSTQALNMADLRGGGSTPTLQTLSSLKLGKQVKMVSTHYFTWQNNDTTIMKELDHAFKLLLPHASTFAVYPIAELLF